MKKTSGIRVLGGLFLKRFYFRASSNHAAFPQAHNSHRREAVAVIHASLSLRRLCWRDHVAHLTVKTWSGARRHRAILPAAVAAVKSGVADVKKFTAFPRLDRTRLLVFLFQIRKFVGLALVGLRLTRKNWFSYRTEE